MNSRVPYSLSAYQLIRERILALEADVDEQTLADTLEGLTDLHEVLEPLSDQRFWMKPWRKG